MNNLGCSSFDPILSIGRKRLKSGSTKNLILLPHLSINHPNIDHNAIWDLRGLEKKLFWGGRKRLDLVWVMGVMGRKQGGAGFEENLSL